MNLCKQFAKVIDVHSIYEGGVKINHLLSHGIFRKENIFLNHKGCNFDCIKTYYSNMIFYGFLTTRALLCHKI